MAKLVWIHGLGESSTSFAPVVAHPALAAHEHQLFDLPGYGRNDVDTAPTKLVPLADALAKLVTPDAVLVGHSMGGVLATLIAERVPVRAVIDVDGNLSAGDCTFSRLAAAYSLEDFVNGGFAKLRDAVYLRGLEELPLRGYFAAMTFAAPAVFHGHALDLVAMSEIEDLAPRLVALPCPHLFIAGVPDGVCTYSHALLDRAGAHWVGIEPAGHWVYLDQLDRFATHVDAFVKSLP